jgi:hypothetical protein
LRDRTGRGGAGEGVVGKMERGGVFKLAGLMSVDDGLDHRQSMMCFMELGTAAGRKEI